MLRRLSSSASSHQGSICLSFPVEAVDNTLSTRLLSGGSLEAMELSSKLPYWDRAWIVQENILPVKATAVLGSSTLEWADFFKASQSFITQTTSCCRLLDVTLSLATRNKFLLFFAKLSKVATIRNR